MTANNYNKLRKKYNLPDLGKLIERLEIEVEKDKEPVILLQAIRNSITEQLYDLMKVLESIMFTGEGSDANLLYQEHMIKDVSGQGFELYKQLNELHYNGLKLRFSHKREEDAQFIKKIFDIWSDMEQKLFLFFEALEKGWKEIDVQKELKAENYHG